jgi:hypothetical protein
LECRSGKLETEQGLERAEDQSPFVTATSMIAASATTARASPAAPAPKLNQDAWGVQSSRSGAVVESPMNGVPAFEEWLPVAGALALWPPPDNQRKYSPLRIDLIYRR